MSRSFGIALGLCFWSVIAWAAEETAAEISRKSREQGGLNLLDLTAEIRLTTQSKDGKKKVQVLSSTTRKIDGRTHSIARFSEPASVVGVSVLTVEGKGGEADDIALYLPKLKRVRKVAKTQRGQSFMDTDFNYADLGNSGADDDHMKRNADQKIDGRDAFVLNGNADEYSPYGEVTLYIDRETYVPVKVDYKDKDQKPFKVYRATKLKKYKDRTLATEAIMENLQTGSKTLLEILHLDDSKLGDEAFTERGLERG